MQVNKCPYCNNDDIEIFYKSDQPLIIRAVNQELGKKLGTKQYQASYCHECDLVLNANPANIDELKQIYSNYNAIKPGLNLGKSKFNETIKFIKNLCSKDKSVLEIGSSDGYVLNEISGEVNLAKGCDPSNDTDFAINNYGLDVKKEYYRSNLFDIKFDLIYMLHVYEHLQDPFSFLDEVKKDLNNNGLLFIEVPSLKYYLENGQISLFIHEHLHLYSHRFIHKLAQDYGFEVIYIKESNNVTRILLKLNNEFDDCTQEIMKYNTKKLIEKFSNQVESNMFKLEQLIKNESNWIVWGAGSVSTLAFNQFNENINKKLVFTDGDETKYDKYIPGIDKKIHPPEKIDFSKRYNLIIASSFINEIMEEVKNIEDLKINKIYKLFPKVKRKI